MQPSARQIMLDMYEQFMAIHEQWPDKGGEAYARQMLEHDVLLLGSYFGTVDPIGQFAEFSLLAECLAYLRMMQSTIATDKMMDSWIDRILAELKDQAGNHRLPVASDDVKQMTEQMRALPLVDDLAEQELITEAQKQNFHYSLIDLANLFVMRDGMITDKELEAITAFEKLLAAD